MTHQSLCLDEANGVRIAEQGFREIIAELKSDASPPLHYLLLHLWMKIFGNGELSVRNFVAIFGFLLIPAICYIGSSLFSRKVGLISAFIASIGEFHVMYSQEVRMYSMPALLGLLSIYFIYKALTTDRKTSWIGYIVFTTLAIYTHNYGLFVATSGAVFSVIYLLKRRKKPWRLLISLGIIAIVYTPWLPILIGRQYGNSAMIPWIPYMRFVHVPETFVAFCGLGFDVFKPFTNSLIRGFGFTVFLYSFLVGIFSIKQYKNISVPYVRTDMNLILILCYFFVTLAIPMLASIKKPIFLSYRYSISAWPAFPLILGLGLSKIRNRYILMIPLVLIAFVSFVSLCHDHFVVIKSLDRNIASFIDSRARDNDVIVFAPSWYGTAINYYLHSNLKTVGYPWTSTKEVAKDTEQFEKRPEDVVSAVKARLDNAQSKIFLVRLVGADWIPDTQTVKNLFDQSFEKLEDETYRNLGVTIYVTEYVERRKNKGVRGSVDSFCGHIR